MDTIENIQDLVNIGTKYKHDWFRGHSKCFNNLAPRIFREFNFSNFPLPVDEVEQPIICDFKRIAPSLKNKLPKSKEHLKWLILMQHFGTPTRLLDWSESILISAFFACSSNFCEDGEIWGMYPQELNKHSLGGEVFPLESSGSLKFLAGEVLHRSPKELAEKLGLKNIIDKPIAFYPTFSFSRMTSQQSTFTIHPKPIEGNSIQEILRDENLRRYIISKDKKKKILEDLISLGINYHTLFQNLDNLSKDLVYKYSNPMWNAWGQPPN